MPTLFFRKYNRLAHLPSTRIQCPDVDTRKAKRSSKLSPMSSYACSTLDNSKPFMASSCTVCGYSSVGVAAAAADSVSCSVGRLAATGTDATAGTAVAIEVVTVAVATGTDAALVPAVVVVVGGGGVVVGRARAALLVIVVAESLPAPFKADTDATAGGETDMDFPDLLVVGLLLVRVSLTSKRARFVGFDCFLLLRSTGGEGLALFFRLAFAVR